MRAIGALLLGLAACSFDHGSLPETVDASATARTRERLTFTNASRAEPLVDFPVLVVLDASRIDYAATAPGGADLRFADAGGAPLAYEIESWQPSGKSFVWVRVPQIDAASNADFIWMSWGDPAAVDAQNPAGVWPADTVAVWHLAQDPGPGGTGDIRDSTSGGHDGTAAASMTADDLGPGAIGMAIQFEGTAEQIYAGSAFALPTYTWSLWLEATAAPTVGMVNRDLISNGDVAFNFAWDHYTPTYTTAAAQRDATQWHNAQIGGNLSGGVWYHVASTFDGTSLCVYLDGASVTCVSSEAPLAPTLPFSIGGGPTGANTFHGWVDEVRVSSVARSPIRLEAEHASETDHFVVFGMPETAP